MALYMFKDKWLETVNRQNAVQDQGRNNLRTYANLNLSMSSNPI